MRFSKILSVLGLLALAACYHPLYGDKPLGSVAPTAQEQRLNAVLVAPIDGENGQKLRNLLIDRMYGQGRPARTDQRLEIVLTITEEHLGLQKNAVTARARLTVVAVYKLIDGATHKPLFSAAARSIVSFDILDEQYATLTSRENAVDRGATEVADRIVNRLLVYFDEQK
jgi:LPS-assembly lipoprotein